MRTESGGYRRDHLRALAQRIEVDAKEVRIIIKQILIPLSFQKASSGGVSWKVRGSWSGSALGPRKI